MLQMKLVTKLKLNLNHTAYLKINKEILRKRFTGSIDLPSDKTIKLRSV